MLSESQIAGLSTKGWLVVPMPDSLTAMVKATLADWHGFFQSERKFMVGGDRRLPRGYLPFCERNGCEMKESFYVQPGYAVPSEVKRSSAELIATLGRIAEAIATSLSEATGTTIAHSPRFGCLRLMRYPALEGEAESALMKSLAQAGALRSPQHCDESAITLLPAASEPGLEICGEGGSWLACDTDPQALTIILGKLAPARAPQQLRAAIHRVTLPYTATKMSRMACAYFVG